VVGGFTRAFTDIAKVAAGVLLRDVTRAMVSIGKESIMLGAQVETLQNSFNALKGDTEDSVLSLASLSAAVDGTVSNVDLLTAANQAMALGLPIDDLNNLFAAARKVGAAMGRTTLQSVQDLTTGIGRQSKLILDNLGIIVNTEQAYEDYAKALGKSSSELTDNESKTAFANAAISQLNKKAAILGDNISNVTTMQEKMTSSIKNLKTEIGTYLIPIVTDLTDVFIKDMIPQIKEIIELFQSRNFEEIGTRIRTFLVDSFSTAIAFLKTIDFMGMFQGLIGKINWGQVWNSLQLYASRLWVLLGNWLGQAQTAFNTWFAGVNWNQVWVTLLTFVGGLWDQVKPYLTGWGDKFKALLPQGQKEWEGIWSALFDFLGVLWSDYFKPVITEVLSALSAFLPKDTTEWANLWYGLWAYATVLWGELLKAAGDMGKAFATWVTTTNWNPLIVALRDTVGEAIKNSIVEGIKSGAVSGIAGLFGLLGTETPLGEILGMNPSAYSGTGGTPTSSSMGELLGIDPSVYSGARNPSTGFQDRMESIRDTITINIGNFIGLDEASTRRALANAISGCDVDELKRRGVRP